jgi:ADP-heptose:LPS heptosyltransferase
MLNQSKEAGQKEKSKVAVYFYNGIGNLLMMTPAIQALSRLYGNTKIDIVLPSELEDNRTPVIKEIFEAWELINKVILFPAEQFNFKEYELLFSTGHGEKSQASSLFEQKGNKFEQAGWMGSYPHEVEYYMEEVYKLGYKGEIPPVVIPLSSKPIIKDNNFKIAIYNGAAQLSKRYRWERKKWHKFEKLIPELRNYYQASILYLGGKGESKEGKDLAHKFSFVTNYAGKLSFLESAKVLSQCDLLISSDSSLMHVAEAVSVPVLVLFGSTLVSKNRPFSGNYGIIRGNCNFAPCQYTTKFTTCNNFICMDSIDTGDVMRAAREII